MVFFFNDTATTEIYTLSLHDALPIFAKAEAAEIATQTDNSGDFATAATAINTALDRIATYNWGDSDTFTTGSARSEEHTSELQSQAYLVCRLLLEKKKEKR